MRLKPKTPRKVCLVGMGSDWSRCFTLGPSWELWGVNRLWRLFQSREEAERFTLWVEIHRPDIIATRTPDQLAWLELPHDFPIYVQDAGEGWPSAVTFPRQSIEEAFPRGDYHAGSFDWMMALALLLGATEITCCGVMLAHCEPRAARACLEYWIGLAEGRGVPVTMTEPTNIGKITAEVEVGGQYGFDHFNHYYPIGWMREQRQAEFRAAQATVDMHREWLEAARDLPAEFIGTSEDAERAANAVETGEAMRDAIEQHEREEED